MNYYIDFDNTLFETAKLTEKMLTTIATVISDETKIDFNEAIQDVKENFNSSFDNIFSYACKVSKKYNINSDEIINKININIENCEDLVFEDVKRFLEKIKVKENKIILLTFTAEGNQDYQLKKIHSSGLTKYFDIMIITTKPKYELDINYENGIFIDDNVNDLQGIYEKNPIKAIRIRRKNNKHSKKELNNSNIEEYESFDEIKNLNN